MNSQAEKDRFKREYCPGCYDDVYNQGCGGAKECWGLETARVGNWKLVHINDRPPWKQAPIETLSCFKRQHFVKIRPEIEQ